MKIHRDIHESLLILTLDLVGLRVRRDCKRTRDPSFSLSKVNNKILEKSTEDIIPNSPLGTPRNFSKRVISVILQHSYESLTCIPIFSSIRFNMQGEPQDDPV